METHEPPKPKSYTHLSRYGYTHLAPLRSKDAHIASLRDQVGKFPKTALPVDILIRSSLSLPPSPQPIPYALAYAYVNNQSKLVPATIDVCKLNVCTYMNS